MNDQKELEAARSVFEKAILKAHELNSKQIAIIHVAIGEIAELDRNLIRSHWRELSRGTPAEQAQVHFRLIFAEAQCMACFQKYHPEGGEIHCPHCGSFGAKILSGEEFYLESIEMENE